MLEFCLAHGEMNENALNINMFWKDSVERKQRKPFPLVCAPMEDSVMIYNHPLISQVTLM